MVTILTVGCFHAFSCHGHVHQAQVRTVVLALGYSAVSVLIPERKGMSAAGGMDVRVMVASAARALYIQSTSLLSHV
jgi:hypothetical protein